jgi:Protein of unknown function (DUF1059)
MAEASSRSIRHASPVHAWLTKFPRGGRFVRFVRSADWTGDPRGETMAPPPFEEVAMKVVHCPCGTDVSGATDDELVSAVEAHVQQDHPDMVGQMDREQILGMAHEH